ncbi:MAG: glycosyltransferase [Caldilineaceae bacterium]
MKLLIFDPETAGHHPGYLRHLLRYWPDHHTHLIFVVSPEFATHNPDVVQTPSVAQVTWQPITQEELRWYEESKRSVVRRSWVEWRLYSRYAHKVQADEGLIMYMDRFQLPMALRFFLPCKTSGIFFRPKFHYVHFVNHQLTGRERLHREREQWLWRSALRHPQLNTLFCLDRLAVEPLQALGGGANVVALPDPVEIYPQSPTVVAALRRELGIAPERTVLLLFGMIDRRKGIYQVLEALQQLPAEQQTKLTFLMVGPLASADRGAITTTISTLRCETSLQIVLCDRFIADEEIQSYFALADLVLALYQRHVGSSGILIRAAAAGKPVLASEYGLMGELVRRHQLGLAVNSADASRVANAIVHFLQVRTDEFNSVAAASWAQSNSAIKFSATIQRNLLCLE